MTLPKNAITWFSIPASNFKQSVKFYEDLLDIELIVENMGGDLFARFPNADQNGVTGAVTADERYRKSGAGTGVVCYLACNSIDSALAKVDSIGGSVQAPKASLPGGMGDIAVVIDCDGNPIGLHQA